MSQISISLQTQPTTDPARDSLQYLIHGIHQQKGSFRNVTEESLKEEIKKCAEEEAIEAYGDLLEADSEVEDDKTRASKLVKARGDMVKQIKYMYRTLREVGQLNRVRNAQDQSQKALDLVSVLLSKPDKVGMADATISPIVKQNLPKGSVATEVLRPPQESGSQTQMNDMISMGWKMQSLNRAADSLLTSASKLEDRIGKETAYWNQVLSVKEKGWSLLRLPREKHTLGVHYGFAEAHPSFRDRGLAALRPSLDGSLSLDRGLSASKGRLRLRTLRQGKAGATVLTPAKALTRGSLHEQILQARDSLYDEELFFEIDREAQHLANQGVRCADDAVLLPFEKDTQIEISLSKASREADPAHTEEDQALSTIMQSLRLLLSQEHLENLQNRSQPPAPLRGGSNPRRVYPILERILEVLQHRARMTLLGTKLEGFKACLAQAGLTCSHEIGPKRDINKQYAVGARAHAVTSFISSLTTTTLNILLPSQSEPVQLHASTSISPPRFGTTYRVSRQGKHIATFDDLSDLELELCVLIEAAIKDSVKQVPGWQGATVGIEWVSLGNKARRLKDNLAIEFRDGVLKLNWQRTGGGTFGQGPRGEWVWNGEVGVGEETTLMKILQEIIEC